MDQQAFFWKIVAGELPAPKAAETLGIVFKHIDAEADTMGPALAASAIVRAMVK